MKYLRHDNYKITLQVLTTPIDEVIIEYTFFPNFRQLAAIKPVLLSLFTPVKASPIKVKNKAEDKILFRPRSLVSHKETVRQEKIMSKTGKRPHYLYSNNINEVAETTEAYSADMVRSFDIEKEVTNVTDQRKLSEVESTEEKQADQTDSAREVKDDLL